MFKQEKKDLVSQIKSELAVNNVVLLMEHGNLTFSAFDDARRAANSHAVIKKVKNNLLKIAFDDSKTYSSLNEHLRDERLVIMSNDLFAACKSAKFLLDNNKNQLKILKGASNTEVYEPSTLIDLANVNSIEDLQSQLLRVIKVVGENILRVIKARCDAKSE